MALLEVIFEFLIIDWMRSTGIFVRWNFVIVGQFAKGSQVTSLPKYHRKMARDRDPSNRMSDGIIHWILGAGAWLGVILILDIIVE